MDPHHGSGYDADGAEDDRDAVFPHGDSAWFGPGRGRPASDEGGSSHVTNRLGFDSLDLNGGGRWTGGGAYPDYFGGFNEVPPTAPRPIRVPTRPMTQAGAGISPPWSHPHAPPPLRPLEAHSARPGLLDIRVSPQTLAARSRRRVHQPRP